jgi:FO synthase
VKIARYYLDTPLSALLEEARAVSAAAHGRTVTYSRKVFIPLTRLCRDSCAYCTFAITPRKAGSAYLSPDQVLAIARAGAAAGCHEALFTLGDKPELRYPAARHALDKLGFATTIDYLAHVCGLVLNETGLLPHVNAGLMSAAEMEKLRAVTVSQGLMLESISPRLCERGGPHFGSPDKEPQARLTMIAQAGDLRIPFTSGILIGIGETREERIASLIALRDVHERHAHLQEVIVQNFRAKRNTRMAGHREPDRDDLLWTAAVARLILGGAMNVQVPPNLSYDSYPDLLRAGINDWGGVSPVTPDHVNPEAAWPQIAALDQATAAAGMILVPRLAAYPAYLAKTWQHPNVLPRIYAAMDADGYARPDAWAPGASPSPPAADRLKSRSPSLSRLIDRLMQGDGADEDRITALFAARGADVDMLAAAADTLRRKVNGDVATYVVNRNVNYTNICTFKCRFCAFSKGPLGDTLRGPAYDLSLDEVARRVQEAWDRGAVEVCMQGGIHPHYTGDTYLNLVRTVKEAVPGMHVHAFSPLEVAHGAETLGISIRRFLERLQTAGLGSLPGTAAEILDDEVRAEICPDKLSTHRWLRVVETAHQVGLKTTATIMFGHVETPRAWARHLLHIRNLQTRSGGFTEFVPLPFVASEAPMFLSGKARRGPTWRETVLMHAIARLVLHPVISNIQVSWVKTGPAGAAALLAAGVNDLGGTLMNESISRAAGAAHGQELPPERMDAVIRAADRTPMQRTTLYKPAAAEASRRSYGATPLSEPVLTPPAHRLRRAAPLATQA